MTFEDEKHYNREIILGDQSSGPVHVKVSHWHYKKERRQNVSTVLIAESGPMRLQVEILPQQARELSSYLLAHADDVEARNEQISLEAIAA